jgi:protein ImuB
MFAILYIPNFALQAAFRYDEKMTPQPVALVDFESTKPIIVQTNSAAKTVGVVHGLTISQAKARCKDLIIKKRSIGQEQTTTDLFLQTATAFSPRIESTAPGVCTMELTGLGFQNNLAGMQPWAERILQALTQCHLEAKIGIASTPDLALLAARHADPIILLTQDSDYISNLPIAALEPPTEILEILTSWGIRTVSAFIALGKDNLVERFGARALELFQRVSPRFVRPLNLIAPPEQYAEQIDFEREIETAEPLLFILRRFVEQLSHRLLIVHLVVAELQLQLCLSSGAKLERCLKLPTPTHDIGILFRILQTHLETVRTESAIVSLRLIATPGKSASYQFGLFDNGLRDPHQFTETISRLMALCGSGNVGAPALLNTYRPDAFEIQPPNFDAPNPGGHGAARYAGLALRRFRPRLSAHIEFRDHQPVLINSPIYKGTIANARGPFISSGDWWDNQRWVNEEWDVQTSSGVLYCLCGSIEGWFLEGVYD